MKVRELIAILETHKPGNDVVIDVRVSSKRYGVAQLSFSRAMVTNAYTGTCISVYLPHPMYVAQRKEGNENRKRAG